MEGILENRFPNYLKVDLDKVHFQLEADIIVKKDEVARPFSVGLMSRSLNAVGMDIDSSVKFASDVRDFLLQNNIHEISTDELNNKVKKILQQKSLTKIAERFRKYREIKTANKPIIIFVGGATGSGKSTLATEIAHRLRINRIISTDAIRSIMRSMISPDLLPSIHKSSFEVWQAHPFSFSANVDQVLSSFVDQATKISVAVKALVDRAIKENLHVILEGVHLLPGIYDAFISSKDIYFTHIFVGVENEEEHRLRFIKRGNSSINRPGQRYLDNFEAIRKLQSFVLDEANKFNLKIFKDKNFFELSNNAIGYILDQW